MSEPLLENDYNLSRMAFTDPYVEISYSGVEDRTNLFYADYNPVYYQDIIYNIEVGII